MLRNALFMTIALAMVLSLGNGLSYAASAKDNYDFYCVQCHGAKGAGDGINVTKDMSVTPRNHADPKEMAKLTDKDMFNAIKEGGVANSKSPLMPPFGATITDKETEDLVKYLRQLCKCKHGG